MGLDVASIGSTSFSTTPERGPRVSRGARNRRRGQRSLSSGDIPASPPPEVLEAMDAAGRAARELHAQGRELRFATAEGGAADRGPRPRRQRAAHDPAGRGARRRVGHAAGLTMASAADQHRRARVRARHERDHRRS